MAQLLISGDAIYVPLSSRPTRTGRAYDQDGERGVETWRKLLERVIADNMLICGTHFPWPGVGRVANRKAPVML
jgi:glyoxylase-like metal-dependent hydrolase (beta-lactamase superfamily II)